MGVKIQVYQNVGRTVVGWDTISESSWGSVDEPVLRYTAELSESEHSGTLVCVTDPSNPITETVYFFNGMKLVQPVLVKEEPVPPLDVAQKFLAGIPQEIVERVVNEGRTTLREMLRDHIANFARDLAHDEWPEDFFSPAFIEMAGGEEWAQEEDISLSDPFDADDYEPEDEEEFKSEPEDELDDA